MSDRQRCRFRAASSNDANGIEARNCFRQPRHGPREHANSRLEFSEGSPALVLVSQHPAALLAANHGPRRIDDHQRPSF